MSKLLTVIPPSKLAYDVEARTHVKDAIVRQYSRRGENELGINAVVFLWAHRLLEVVGKRDDEGHYSYTVYRTDYPAVEGDAICTYCSRVYNTQKEALADWHTQCSVLDDMDDAIRHLYYSVKEKASA